MDKQMDVNYIESLRDEVNGVLDYVISDILKINNEDVTAFKVGDIVQSDDSDLGVVTHVNGCLIYVMRADGTFTLEQSIDWYKVGRLNWIPGMMSQINDVLEEY